MEGHHEMESVTELWPSCCSHYFPTEKFVMSGAIGEDVCGGNQASGLIWATCIFSCLHLKCTHKWSMQPETIQPENYNLWQSNRITHVLLKDRDRQSMFTVAHSLNGQWSTDWKANTSNIKYLCQATQLSEKPEPEECVVIMLDAYRFSDRHCIFFIRKA